MEIKLKIHFLDHRRIIVNRQQLNTCTVYLYILYSIYEYNEYIADLIKHSVFLT